MSAVVEGRIATRSGYLAKFRKTAIALAAVGRCCRSSRAFASKLPTAFLLAPSSRWETRRVYLPVKPVHESSVVGYRFDFRHIWGMPCDFV